MSFSQPFFALPRYLADGMPPGAGYRANATPFRSGGSSKNKAIALTPAPRGVDLGRDPAAQIANYCR